MRWETFAPLEQLDFITHAFTLRTDEDTRADNYEARVANALGFPEFVRADQPHGANVAVVSCASAVSAADALITGTRNLALTVRCADCPAVFIVDRATPAIALAHSGKAGTQANIVGTTLAKMKVSFGTNPRDCVAFISPSIGPCHYETDLWSAIEQQLRDAGVTAIHNPRVCSACHLDRYFSYRAEKGHTGRMLAVLALRPK